MTQEQINAIIRWVLTLAGGWLLNKGILSQEQITSLSALIPALIGAGMGIGAIVWSVIEKRKQAADLAAAKAAPAELPKIR